MSVPWQASEIGDILKRATHTVKIEPDKEYREITVKLWGKGVVLRGIVSGAKISGSRRFVAKSGQFILSRIDARNGAFGLVPKELDGAVVTNDFPLFDFKRALINPDYLSWLSRTNAFVELCERASEGTTNRVRLQEARFLSCKISLPPLEEQRRIVVQIEELLAKIEEARELRGQTTEEARRFDNLMVSVILRNSKNAKMIPIEQFAEVRGGIQKGPHRIPGKNAVRYLTVAHVQRNRILVSDPRFFEVSPSELDKWKLDAGDVLIIEGNGSAEQIGRTALFRGEIDPCVHQNHVIRIRPNSQEIDPEYLNCYLNSPVGQDEVHSRSRTTSGLRNLSVGRIKEIRVLVPPLTEQHRIVVQLEVLEAKMNALKQLQNETATELNALAPSILDKAFKGNL